jgi:hypothetical protein
MALLPAIAVGVSDMSSPMPQLFDVTGVMGNRRMGSDGSACSQGRHSRIHRTVIGEAYWLVQSGWTTGKDGRAADQVGAPDLLDCCKRQSPRCRVRLRRQPFRCLHWNDDVSGRRPVQLLLWLRYRPLSLAIASALVW